MFVQAWEGRACISEAIFLQEHVDCNEHIAFDFDTSLLVQREPN